MESRTSMQISVVITCYNARATLGEALTSVLAQTRPPDEIIVVDDGSTDDSATIVNQVAPQAILISQTNQGVSAARNAGLRAVTGDLIAFLDDDDRWHPSKLERQLAVLDRYPHVDLLATTWSRTDPVPTGNETLRWVSYRDLTLMNQFQTSTVLMRRELATNTSGFDPRLDAVEDWAYWISCAKLGTVAVLEDQLVLYRDSTDGVSKNLHRFWHRMQIMLECTDACDRLEHSDRSVITAWHTQRMLVASALDKDVTLLAPILWRAIHIAPRAHVKALSALTVPFLRQRLTRRAS
jgi:glycosyltransferase involved in cell wall biosynthesis